MRKHCNDILIDFFKKANYVLYRISAFFIIIVKLSILYTSIFLKTILTEVKIKRAKIVWESDTSQ